MLRLRTLGMSQIQIGEHTLGAEHSAMFLLLLLAALRAPHELSRHQVAELLWPEAAPPVRSHRLRSLLHRVRQAGTPLECTDTSIRFRERPVVDFRELVTTPRSLDEVRRLLPHLGAILPGVGVPGTPMAARLDDERDVIRATVVRWLAAALKIATAASDGPLVEQLARAGRCVDPFNEEEWLTLAGGEHRRMIASAPRHRRVAEREGVSRPDDVGASFDASHDVARQIVTLIAQARRGRGTALLVWGPPGSGKSRLLQSIMVAGRGLAARPIMLTPRAGSATPTTLVLDLAARLLDVPGAAGCEPEAYETLRAATTHAPHESGALADANAGDLVDALVELLAAIGDEAPCILLVDDVPRMQEATCLCWRKLLERSRSHRVAWLLAYDADDEDDLAELPDEKTLPRVALLTQPTDSPPINTAMIAF